jgi:uncharacterized membrane protein YdbT with pleckstrin-like domain
MVVVLGHGAVRSRQSRSVSDPAGDRGGDHDQPPGDRDVQLHPGRRPGLRITCGLTNPTSQSVPINRIQGLKITQSLWKPLGLYRVDTTSSTWALEQRRQRLERDQRPAPGGHCGRAALAISRVLPGIDLDQVELHLPRRARWARWLDFWTSHG